MRLARRQRGLALVVVLGVALLIGAYFALASFSISSVRVMRDRSSDESLRLAKEALIAYAVADPNRPGELPCPDVNDDGQLVLNQDYGPGGVCMSLIGRLPWRTLDLPDLRDDSGQRLWYAVSADFRAGNTAVPLNSDTAFRAGNTSLSINGTQTATGLAALVIAPGVPIVRQGAPTLQDRGTAAARLLAVNYLDIAAGEDNADANRIFIAAAKSENFNDRLAPIHSDDIMRLVERRAGGELAQNLRQHYDNWRNAASISAGSRKGFYPWAAPLTDPTVAQPGTNGTTAGLLPMSAASVLWDPPAPTLGVCAGANTTQITCTAATLLGTVVSINARVRNVGTAFVDPPTAASVTTTGIVIGPVVTWTLNPAQNALDFSFSATVLGLVTVTADAPAASAWTGAGSWLVDNNWPQVTHYALSPGYALTGGDACGGVGPQCVSVNNTAAPGNDKQAVVVMAGRALPVAGQGARPFATPPAPPASQFLESENATPGDLIFEVNLRSDTFNDTPVIVRP